MADVWWNRHCDPDKTTSEPVRSESISGAIPHWISGVLYRTGPGVHFYGSDSFDHVLDCTAILHAIEIQHGQAKYRSRVLECDSFQKNQAANRIVVTEMGTRAMPDPCMTLLGRFMNRFARLPDPLEGTDNGVVNLFFHGDELFATTETNIIRRVDPSTLQTIGPGTRHSDSIAIHQASAHHHSVPDGTLYKIGQSMSWGTVYHNVVKFPPPSHGPGGYLSAHDQASVVARVAARSSLRVPYHHSFGMTENYFILLETPFALNMMKAALSNATQSPPMTFFEWDPKGVSTFILVRRDTGVVHPTRYSTRALACFHHINAYEARGHVVVDLCATDGTLLEKSYVQAVAGGHLNIPPSIPVRFALPLTIPNGPDPKVNLVDLPNSQCQALFLSQNMVVVEEEVLSPHTMDLPQINYEYNGQNYRYFYSTKVDTDDMTLSALYKIDVKKRKTVKTFQEDSTIVSEPSFIPMPNAKAEDDGMILCLLTRVNDPSYAGLLGLEAKDFSEVFRSHFRANGPVTPTLHGTFRMNPKDTPIF